MTNDSGNRGVTHYEVLLAVSAKMNVAVRGAVIIPAADRQTVGVACGIHAVKFQGTRELGRRKIIPSITTSTAVHTRLPTPPFRQLPSNKPPTTQGIDRVPGLSTSVPRYRCCAIIDVESLSLAASDLLKADFLVILRPVILRPGTYTTIQYAMPSMMMGRRHRQSAHRAPRNLQSDHFRHIPRHQSRTRSCRFHFPETRRRGCTRFPENRTWLALKHHIIGFDDQIPVDRVNAQEFAPPPDSQF